MCCTGGKLARVLPVAPSEGPDEKSDYSGPGPWFACMKDSLIAPRLAKVGAASEEGCSKRTLMTLWEEALKSGSKAQKPCLKIERPCPVIPEGGKPPPPLPDDQWTTLTYGQTLDDIKRVARALVKLGFEQFDSVNIWAFNCPEWFIAAYAANFAGGKVAGLYPTDNGETAAYKVVHSGGSVVCVEDRGKLGRLKAALDARGDCTKIKIIVAFAFDPADNETIDIKGCSSVSLISWKKLLEFGDDPKIDLAARSLQVLPGHCAGLIYTSGTTGQPKAVMISHDNIIWESSCIQKMVTQSTSLFSTPEQGRILSYLPLSHVAGMMVDIVSPVVAASITPSYITVYFARQYDLKAGSLKDRLQAARPHIFLGVPLVWEKIADKIRAIGASTKGLKKKIATWAKSKGLTYARNCQLGGSGHMPSNYGLAQKLVLSKIMANLGLDQCKFGFTGAAPIRVDTLEFFASLGVVIKEVYGMSECTGACTWSLDEALQWGSCGWEMPGVEVRAFNVDPHDLNKKTEMPKAPSLDETDEKYMGELCFRGRNIMMGYMANPDLGPAHVEEMMQKNKESIDAEGWLHSGDKGLVTSQGMVKITGRYKELIIGAGGENIAPVPIEDHIKKVCDGIAEIMMVGDKRKYNVCLVTLKAVGANGEVPGTNQLDAGAARINPDVRTISAAMADKVWIQAVTDAITSANNNPKVCPNNTFKIQKFTMLPTNFSEENNELTPTKKLKRAIVAKRYASTIDMIYESSDTYVRYKDDDPQAPDTSSNPIASE